jgi:hypothetical protein
VFPSGTTRSGCQRGTEAWGLSGNVPRNSGDSIRVDRSPSGDGSFREGETAYLRFTLDFEGVPFLDDLGGGWVSGQGPGWVLHHRKDPGANSGDEVFFPGIALTDEETAREAALEFLASSVD